MLKKLGKCMLAALLSVCTVLTAAPAMQAVRAADEAVIIDDTEFEYSGNGDANAGGWESYGSGDPAVTEQHSGGDSAGYFQRDKTGTVRKEGSVPCNVYRVC